MFYSCKTAITRKRKTADDIKKKKKKKKKKRQKQHSISSLSEPYVSDSRTLRFSMTET